MPLSGPCGPVQSFPSARIPPKINPLRHGYRLLELRGGAASRLWEVLARLVPATVFKIVGPYVHHTVGGFDSHALPLSFLQRMVGTSVKQQHQFLDVVDCETARERFEAAVAAERLESERVPLAQAWGRVLAEDIVAGVDVPGFDRSDFDGFAVCADDLTGADEESPRYLHLLPETAAAGRVPQGEVQSGWAMPIATGGIVPRGADAVVMVEDTEVSGDRLAVRRAVPPGFGITFAGTDISQGERVLLEGTILTSRETAVLAAVGLATVPVVRRPRIGLLSTGDEIVAPGSERPVGAVFDSNQRVLADALRESGAEPVELGIVPDQREALRTAVAKGLKTCDGLLLSGGTSKGAGDISYEVVRELGEICAHGVAIKPGKPICLASTRGKPLVVLPGFPTSAIFTFHEFVAPVIRRMAGRTDPKWGQVEAELAVPVRSQMGRREYLLVSLVKARKADRHELVAFPLGKGSGSVTTFSHADGFVAVDRHCELVDAGESVTVRLLSSELPLADLVVVGSHCVGLDWILSQLHRRGVTVRFLAVGSWGGLEALKQGRCDVAGMHLFDPKTETYNRPFLTDELVVLGGYQRCQGIVFRQDDPRLAGADASEICRRVREDASLRMVNRNASSGTRVLIDRLLEGRRPAGYGLQPRTHHAVAAAVAQGRADWGVAIEWVARERGLGFCPLQEETYELVGHVETVERPSVVALRSWLAEEETARELGRFGFRLREAEPVGAPQQGAG